MWADRQCPKQAALICYDIASNPRSLEIVSSGVRIRLLRGGPALRACERVEVDAPEPQRSKPRLHTHQAASAPSDSQGRRPSRRAGSLCSRRCRSVGCAKVRRQLRRRRCRTPGGPMLAARPTPPAQRRGDVPILVPGSSRTGDELAGSGTASARARDGSLASCRCNLPGGDSTCFGENGAPLESQRIWIITHIAPHALAVHTLTSHGA